jgi:uracil-DNA glycosylase family 4
MEPHGTRRPVVYILGEAPGADEDRLGRPFVGKAGKVLRLRIPDDWLPDIRWNNVVRTRPPGNRDPTIEEIEACRPSIIKDIEETKPAAIFGFGNVPLKWATGITSGITKWTGRRIPVQIGKHRCWFFPMVHPSAILRGRRKNKDGVEFAPRNADEYGSDEEFTFALHIKQAFKQVEEGLPPPLIHTEKFARQDIDIYFGEHEEDLEEVVNALDYGFADNPEVGMDYETTDKYKNARPYHEGSKILTVALSGEFHTIAFALDHPEAKWTKEDKAILKLTFKRFLMNYKGRKISHSLPFELEWSAHKFGREVIHAGRWDDSLSQAYIMDERQGAHSLDALCLTKFGIHLKALSGLDRTKLQHSDVADVLTYNAIDAKYHRLLFKAQEKELKQKGLMKIYEHQVRRIPALVATQLKGIPVHVPTVEKFLKEYEGRLEKTEDKLWALPEVEKFRDNKNRKFNPGSNPHIMTVLRRKGYTPDSTEEEELEKIDIPFAKLILEYRGIAKQISTYLKPALPGSQDLYPGDMFHPILSTTKVRTWRTASNGPNIQNQPKHGEIRKIRSYVRAADDEQIVAFDYAGMQARNVAMESKDKVLVDAFWHDYDIHTDWAKEIASAYPEWIKEGTKAFRTDKAVQKIYRQRAKNEFVFASFFGAYPPKLASTLGIPVRIAEKVRDKFFSEFSGIHRWHEDRHRFYKKNGYITGLSGFRRHAPVASTEIINTPIQSDESLIVCSAMASLSEKGIDANMEIHDDLTFIWKKKDVDRLSEIVAKEMTRLSFKWMATVPIVVEMSVGPNWADLKEVAKFSSIELWGHKRK